MPATARRRLAPVGSSTRSPGAPTTPTGSVPSSTNWATSAVGRPDDFDAAATDAAYSTAFRSAALDVDTLGPEATGTRVRAIPAPDSTALVAALDDWALVRRSRSAGPEDWRTIVAAARIADPEPIRDRLRVALLSPDRLGDSREIHDLARAADPRTWPPASLVLLANTLEAAGDRAAGVKLLRRAVIAHPGDFWVHYILGGLLAHSAPPQTEDAIRAYATARALHPETAHELAHLLEHHGRGEEAVEILGDLVARRPDLLRHQVCYGSLLKSQGHDEAATAALDRAVAIGRKAVGTMPDDANVRYELGRALVGLGRFAEAAVEYREAIRLSPSFEGPHHNLGLVLRAQGRWAEAGEALLSAVRIAPDHAPARADLGDALLHLDRRDEGMTQLREAVRLEPDNIDTRTAVGRALCHVARDYTGAEAQFREAVRIDPGNARACCDLGIALRYQGKGAEAAAVLRRAIQLDPKLVSPHFELGAVLCDLLRDYTGAETESREAVRLEPGNAEAHSNLGVALDHQGKHASSAKEHREAVRLKPGSGPFHYLLGNCLLHHSEFEGAVASYREAIRLQPDFAEAHCNLGHALSRLGEHAEALTEFRRGHELGSRQPGLEVSVGQVDSCMRTDGRARGRAPARCGIGPSHRHRRAASTWRNDHRSGEVPASAEQDDGRGRRVA